jgi:hypothetical protein
MRCFVMYKDEYDNYLPTVGDWFNQLPEWKQVLFMVLSLGGKSDYFAFWVMGYYRWLERQSK